ncbi:MAG: molecular chaperone HtpG [Defluviitaleaceae bacterium]|nr:molecular chaperone HtpG [Defluviitaleaceae bacterium]
MSLEKGNLSINSENIMPIIKKWLYSDTDIFIRELVSNASDAVTKLKKLAQMGDAPGVGADETYRVDIVVDKAGRTIEIIDNGIGMTADEVRTYINRIAFSGASEFLEKYKETEAASGEIIGHFGLGFYSAFMVSERVEIDTLSYREGEKAAHWSCDGGVEYSMDEGERSARGTTVTLHINEDSQEFLEEHKLRQMLRKYCGFMPVDIYLEAVKPPSDTPDSDDTTPDASADTDADPDEIVINDTPEAGKPAAKPVNDKSPLWLKPANECTDEEYKEFYHKVFSDFADPLFWIHLNMDYPFRLKGILYFPRLKNELEYIEGQVKLYNNQVFVADNIKEVIPEFLLLLKGTLDCPDIPLNVSRSFLQNDSNVSKMSGYITRKVADKLLSIFKKDRAAYDGYWGDISPFIKYGCIKDRDFYDKMKGALLLKTLSGEYNTIDEFKERNKDKTGDNVYYVSNEAQQAAYIKMFREEGMDAAILSTNLDNPFVSYVESYDSSVRFKRIDSELSGALKTEGEDTAALGEQLQTLFRKHLGNEELKVSAENIKAAGVSAVMLQSEQGRRMEEMSKMFGSAGALPPGMFAQETTLVINTNSPLVKSLVELADDETRSADVEIIAKQIYDLAQMSHKPLDADAMASFFERSNRILHMALK